MVHQQLHRGVFGTREHKALPAVTAILHADRDDGRQLVVRDHVVKQVTGSHRVDERWFAGAHPRRQPWALGSRRIDAAQVLRVADHNQLDAQFLVFRTERHQHSHRLVRRNQLERHRDRALDHRQQAGLRGDADGLRRVVGDGLVQPAAVEVGTRPRPVLSAQAWELLLGWRLGLDWGVGVGAGVAVGLGLGVAVAVGAVVAVAVAVGAAVTGAGVLGCAVGDTAAASTVGVGVTGGGASSPQAAATSITTTPTTRMATHANPA